MLKVLAVVALLSAAQIVPSCDRGEASSDRPPVVIGYVMEKRTNPQETLPWLIVINHIEYGVTYDFWLAVGVGDLVKYDGEQWTILRKARR
ncbi:MAG: hypothetical protein QN187_10985 [Armatimonadota bacterium]|nr:hypothetical protein [Armatimonadota bacterium]MDR7520122.1 hypothetical protein [Armatimonadota bacterium]MDR7549401.1 hypothetical protein [Armatimonadota bacterium]